MRSLATLGGLILLIVLAIAWKISNQVEAGQDVDSNSGVITLGVIEDNGEPAKPAAEENSNSNAGRTSPQESGMPAPPASELGAGAQPSGTDQSGLDSSGEDQNGGSDEPDTEESPTPSQPEPESDPAETTPLKSSSVIYTVAEGDTLYGILMKSYGRANEELIQAIAVANELDDPSALSIGMELKLPEVEGYAAPQRPL